MKFDPKMLEYVKLKSDDCETFYVVRQNLLSFKHITDIEANPNMVVLDNIHEVPISSDVLQKILNWSSRYEDEKDSTDVEFYVAHDWERQFFLDNAVILEDIVRGAAFLQAQPLLRIACQFVVDLIAEKTNEELKELFQVENVVTDEHKEDVLNKISWLLAGYIPPPLPK